MYYIQTVIHLHCEIDGKWCIACIPNGTQLKSTNLKARYKMSGDPLVVNCIMCKRTEIYNKIKGK